MGSQYFDDFDRAMRDALDASRRAYEYREYMETHPVTSKKKVVGYSNKASVQAYQQAVKAAQEEAERLRFVADQTDVPVKLKALKDGLPTIMQAQLSDSK